MMYLLLSLFKFGNDWLQKQKDSKLSPETRNQKIKVHSYTVLANLQTSVLVTLISSHVSNKRTYIYILFSVSFETTRWLIFGQKKNGSTTRTVSIYKSQQPGIISIFTNKPRLKMEKKNLKQKIYYGLFLNHTRYNFVEGKAVNVFEIKKDYDWSQQLCSIIR